VVDIPLTSSHHFCGRSLFYSGTLGGFGLVRSPIWPLSLCLLRGLSSHSPAEVTGGRTSPHPHPKTPRIIAFLRSVGLNQPYNHLRRILHPKINNCNPTRSTLECRQIHTHVMFSPAVSPNRQFTTCWVYRDWWTRTYTSLRSQSGLRLC
jgi:hypothetical protein